MESGDEFIRIRNPAEYATLCFDHINPNALKLGKIRPHAIFKNDTFITPVVGFADSRMDANF